MKRSNTWRRLLILVGTVALSGACLVAPHELEREENERVSRTSAALTSAECAARCDPLNRECDFGAGGVAVCGVCKSGFVFDSRGECVASPPCTTLGCETPICGPGLLWD